jgi:thiol:disulfide interchange protein DsbD
MPKPGEWMETLKQAMAFPLFAYALYLLWVLSAQVDDAGWVRDAGIGMAVIAAACWVWGRWGAPHRTDTERLWGRLGAAGLLVATLAHLYWHLPA